jgi:hypothetical protein
MPFTIEEFRDLLRILEECSEWRSELRRVLLTDDLLSLPQVVRELAEEQRATEKQLQSLTERIGDLTEQVNALVTWQRGEAGRREGERYELNTIKRAPTLFSGGMGGATDSPVVQKRLSKWLGTVLGEERFLEAEEDPTLADLIWWKVGRTAVIEISIKVNGRDVIRAFRRAEVLRSAGVDAFPVVIGEDWDTLEARALAKDKGVEWIVAGMFSEGLIAFRRLPPE